ncbi:MAG: hypothetical protein K1X57_22025 [Gemmataceae bacterium]|mgnify:CR=1 FL=1|nr:hypothetical protein [Gemmataceae bacterium]
MPRILTLTFVLAVAAFAGCGSPPAPQTATVAQPTLSDADKAAVEKQKYCIVANEPLGSMGTPIKVNVKGKDVFLCCEGCREAVLKDPDKYLAKLDANGTVIVDQKAEADAKPAETAPATGAAPAAEPPKAP